MATAPQTTRYDCNRIREGRRLLFVPGGSANWLNLGLDQPVSHQRLHISISAYCRRKLPRQRRIIPSADFSVVTLFNLSLTVSTNVRPHLFSIPTAMARRAPASPIHGSESVSLSFPPLTGIKC